MYKKNAPKNLELKEKCGKQSKTKKTKPRIPLEISPNSSPLFSPQTLSYQIPADQTKY